MHRLPRRHAANTRHRRPARHAPHRAGLDRRLGVTKHPDVAEAIGGAPPAQACHGADYRGTVLSRAQADRSLSVSLDQGCLTVKLFRGADIGCYTCHHGPARRS